MVAKLRCDFFSLCRHVFAVAVCRTYELNGLRDLLTQSVKFGFGDRLNFNVRPRLQCFVIFGGVGGDDGQDRGGCLRGVCRPLGRDDAQVVTGSFGDDLGVVNGSNSVTFARKVCGQGRQQVAHVTDHNVNYGATTRVVRVGWLRVVDVDNRLFTSVLTGHFPMVERYGSERFSPEGFEVRRSYARVVGFKQIVGRGVPCQ